MIALTLCLAVARPASAAEPEAYEKAKVELSRLRGDEKRAQYRHSWLKIADDFMDVYESHSDWINRPAALFRSAEALEEMARRSFVRKDAQNAAARFESVARKHPSSVLADDALYRAAVVRKELMRDDEGAVPCWGPSAKNTPNPTMRPKPASTWPVWTAAPWPRWGPPRWSNPWPKGRGWPRSRLRSKTRTWCAL